jgi:iron-sulfur cluster insertion protein
MNRITNFSLTESARKRIAFLLANEPPQSRFRIAVLGGGCSGFQYQFDLDAAALAEDDQLLEEGGAVVVIDETSLALLAGSELEYTEELVGAAFSIKNPNAKSGCGCGNSFAI